MIRTAALVLSVLAFPALAQDATDFSKELDFEFLGVHKDGLIVSMDEQVVFCDTELSAAGDYHALSNCAPVIAPGQHAAVKRARAMEKFEELVEETPKTMLANAIKDTLRDDGCSIKLDDQPESYLFMKIADRLAKATGFEGEIYEEFQEEARLFKLDEVAEMLNSSGEVSYDSATSVLTLVACE